MQDAALLAATASERLSLEEELVMQAGWRDDPAKVTFIVLDPELGPDGVGRADLASKHVGAMAGDVNLFFNDAEDPLCAEVEVMVARHGSRRKGLALEAVKLMIKYAHDYLGTTRFVAKIGVDNAPSLSLFEQKLGFAIQSTSQVFQEHTLEMGQDQLGALLDSVVLALREDLDEDEPRYETPEMVDQYLALHFGQQGPSLDATIHPHKDRPDHALRFPQRCATLLRKLCGDLQPGARALDIGCAVGGATFELSRWFAETVGVDLSASFVAQAKAIQDGDHSKLSFEVPICGQNTRGGLQISLSPGVRKARVDFRLADACALPTADLGTFDGVLLANLLCRLPRPRDCLAQLASLVRPGGVVLVVSPYSWAEPFTHKSLWLDSASVVDCLTASGEFDHMHSQDLPLILREHERKYEYVVSEALAFRRTAAVPAQ